eukprot:364912-Chlamydomonas_euryale.AAC.2
MLANEGPSKSVPLVQDTWWRGGWRGMSCPLTYCGTGRGWHQNTLHTSNGLYPGWSQRQPVGTCSVVFAPT